MDLIYLDFMSLTLSVLFHLNGFDLLGFYVTFKNIPGLNVVGKACGACI